METKQLKAFAPQARREFIAAVTDRAAFLGLTAGEIAPVTQEGDVAVIAGRPYPKEVAGKRAKLVERIRRAGFEQVMEAMAYTWFNRLVAIRFMELHGYLEHGYRVLSHPEGRSTPEILEHATEAVLPGLDRAEVLELKLDGTRDEELYRLLLLAQCHALHRAMPFLFESLDDETELLLPERLLHTDSLIRKLVESIDESAWESIEIIGWLYQFYISEKKDQVIGKVVKSEDIPAATQLFTPNWIVKYMVQNSLGAQWLATYPNSPLKAQMEYYIEPAEQTDEVNAQLTAITPSTLDPEELTLIDPACGSGHILVEAYDLFKAIYLERGYRQRDVPQLILEKNLFGLDIDERAAQLTGFALMMKARADDRRLFERAVTLNVMALVNSAGFDAEGLAKGVDLVDYGLSPGNLTELKRLFEHATTFGSLIQVPEELAENLPALKQLSEATSQDLFVSEALKRLGPLFQQAELLATQYDAVVANPPYMGARSFNPELKAWTRSEYAGYEKDLFSAFILRMLVLTKQAGHSGIMTSFVWMFITSFAQLRKMVISDHTIGSLVQLQYDAFVDAKAHVCTFVLQKGKIERYRAAFIRLADFPGVENQAPKTRQAIRNRDCGWFFETAPDDFYRIPGCPIAYWVSPGVMATFQNRKLRSLTTGEGKNVTSDNARFVRYAWEVPSQTVGRGAKWLPYVKGGSFRKWAGNIEHVVDWSSGARNYYQEYKVARVIPEELWYRQGITWTDITSVGTGFRYLPPDTTFDATGLSIFLVDEEKIPIVVGLLNSCYSLVVLKLLNSTLHAQLVDIKAVPVAEALPNVTHITERCIRLAKADWDDYERSWDFQSLPLLTASSDPIPTLELSYIAWITSNRDTIAEMKRLEEENNRLFIDAYGLQDELTPDVPLSQITLTVNPAYRYGGKLTEEEQWDRFRQDTMKELVSYATGCMMGRYSLDEPGLIYAHSGNEGFEPDRYASFPADADGILPITGIAWFDDDVAHRLLEFISVAWPSGPSGSHLEANLTFLAENLSPRKNESSRETIRRYLCDSFFKDHHQTYKKRPIYWHFSSGKQKAFQCLVYLHRYNEGTLGRMRTEYVIPLQGRIAARLQRLDEDIDKATSTSHGRKLEKERDALLKQRAELYAFDEKLRHYADRRVRLDLDDGVKVNYGKFGDLLAEVKKITGKAPR